LFEILQVIFSILHCVITYNLVLISLLIIGKHYFYIVISYNKAIAYLFFALKSGKSHFKNNFVCRWLVRFWQWLL